MLIIHYINICVYIHPFNTSSCKKDLLLNISFSWAKEMAVFELKKLFLPTIFLLLLTITHSNSKLDAHYYDQTCPQAEKIILQTVRNASIYDPRVPARLLRMFFHDCFIRVYICSVFCMCFLILLLAVAYIFISLCLKINRF